MAYSVDLREKVLAFIRSGNSKLKASKIFGISRGTINAWEKLEKDTGSLEPIKPQRKEKKIDLERLKSYVQEYPDCILKDYAKLFNVCERAITFAFKKLGITRKKRQNPLKKGMKPRENYIWKSS
jgi:transposase